MRMGKVLPDAVRDTTKGSVPELVGPLLESLSASMRPVETVIRQLAQSDAPILLLGEHGVGKRATAQRIHEMSGRGAQCLWGFRCLALKPEDLDGGQRNHTSPYGAGTIYLDELADLSESCQVYLQEALLPVTEQTARSSPRFICGSSRDLEVEVKSGRLREELYYRIRGVSLRLPPLRQRKEDIPLMMNHFLRRYAEEYRRAVPDLSTETLRLFQDYSWPGNLHELENAARVLVALGDEHLAMGGLRALLHSSSAAVSGGKVSLKAASKAASHEAERELILNALTRTRWNRRRAAKELQISYKALLYKLKQIAYEGYGAP